MALPDYAVVSDSPHQRDFSLEELLGETTDFARDRNKEFKRPSLGLQPLDIPEPTIEKSSLAPRKPPMEKPLGPLSRAINGLRESTKSFNPSLGNIGSFLKSGFVKPSIESQGKLSPDIEAKNKRLETYTGHMDNVRRELEPLGINDVWNTPLHKHGSLREDALTGGTKLDSLEHSFANAINHIESPRSKEMLGKKMSELKTLRDEVAAYKEENPDLPPLEMWPEGIKGKKGAVDQYRAEGLKHLKEGGDHASLVEHYMRTHALKERTAKRHSLNAHKYLKEQLKNEQIKHEEWIENYMKNHLDLPIAQEIE